MLCGELCYANDMMSNAGSQYLGQAYTYLFVALGGSSTTSFPFPLDVVVSRARLEEDVEADGCWSTDARSLSFSFSLAALTLALERNTLLSKLAVDVELEGSARCDVASGCWVESI